MLQYTTGRYGTTRQKSDKRTWVESSRNGEAATVVCYASQTTCATQPDSLLTVVIGSIGMLSNNFPSGYPGLLCQPGTVLILQGTAIVRWHQCWLSKQLHQLWGIPIQRCKAPKPAYLLHLLNHLHTAIVEHSIRNCWSLISAELCS